MNLQSFWNFCALSSNLAKSDIQIKNIFCSYNPKFYEKIKIHEIFSYFRNNRRRQLSGSSMISNNNSQGSDSPLPSPRFSRYIRTPGTSDNSSDSNSSGRPSSATTSSNYKTRVGGTICSQSPNVTNLGKKWGKCMFKEHLQIYFSSNWTPCISKTSFFMDIKLLAQ